MTPISYEYVYLIALGANLGDRESFLLRARQSLSDRAGSILANAGIYVTAPVGAADQQFLNSALLLGSGQTPEKLLHTLLAIETSLGRVREVHWGNRTIDLDIIMAKKGDHYLSVAAPALLVPHPRLLERNFVLCPCVEIAPDWVHPDTKKSLAAECSSRNFSLQPSFRI